MGKIIELLTTIITTAIGVVIGGLITLIVNKRFEIVKIRLNNINEMKKDVTPALQNYIITLKKVGEFLIDNEFYLQKANQDVLIHELKESLANLNIEIDTYEIELSDYLDFFESILGKSFDFIEDFSEIDIINSEKSYYWQLTIKLDKIVDMVATFSEEISEIKRNLLNGKIHKYWEKDIFKKEKETRVNYHKSE